MTYERKTKNQEPSIRCMKMRWLLLLTLALPLVPMQGCKKEAAPEVQVTVQAEHLEQGALSEHITVDAILAPLAQAALAPKISSPVRRFYVQRGSRVKAGQLLATLENSDLQAATQDNKGTFMAAQAAYDTATRAQVPEDAQRAELDVAQAKANLDLNLSIVKSRKQLFSEGAIAGRDLDTATAALVAAQAAYDSAAKHLELVHSVSHAAALQTAAGQLASAEGKYKGAQAEQSYSEIRSPIAGVVTDRPLFAGETAAASTSLLTVMDTSALLAKTHIAQALAQQMKLGDVASVQIPGETNPVAAKVSLISPALDPGSTTVEVWIQLDNRTGKYKVGTPVKVAITGRSVEQAWKIPAAAVQTAQDGSKFVLVVASDGTAHRRRVTLGIVDGEDAQITGGIVPSDLVVTGGAYSLDDGTKVKIGAADDDKASAADKSGGKD
jgi:multidrug efflux pump subunit AcrA (membrane-fusion protein)